MRSTPSPKAAKNRGNMPQLMPSLRFLPRRRPRAIFNIKPGVVTAYRSTLREKSTLSLIAIKLLKMRSVALSIA